MESRYKLIFMNEISGILGNVTVGVSNNTDTEYRLRYFIFNSTVIRIAQICAWPVAYIIFKVFLHYQVHGIENIREAIRLKGLRLTGAIFASNHVSELDDVILTAGVAPRSFFSPMFHVSAPTSELRNKKFRWRRFLYFKLFLRICGAYELHRGTRDYGSALRSHIELLRRGHNITMHPQGRIVYPNDPVPEARGGIGYLAINTKAVVVPTIISGIETMTYKDFFLRRCTLKVTYLPPILAEDITNANDSYAYKHIAQSVVDAYSHTA